MSHHHARLPALVATITGLALPVVAQTLVHDINQRPIPRSSNPADFVAVGNTVFFTATNPTTGRELYATTGPGNTYLVKDIAAGTANSNPMSLTEMGGVLFFAASGTGTGRELWRSDGTGNGTWIVADVWPGPNHGATGAMMASDNVLYFVANNGSSGAELWKSDGTTAGTVLVKDIRPGITGSSPILLAAESGGVLFSANDGLTGQEPWISLGTAATTSLVADIRVGGGSSSPRNMQIIGDAAYYFADDGAIGHELWCSRPGGTSLVRDIRVGSASSSAEFATVVGTELYFAADDGVVGKELWQSDGTPAGTMRAADLQPGPTGANPTDLVELNGVLYFAATTVAEGNEIFSWDGTTVMLVTNIGAGAVSSLPRGLTVSGGQLVFSAFQAAIGSEPWRSGGTLATTALIADLEPGSTGSVPHAIAAVPGGAMFAASSSITGDEPYFTDLSVVASLGNVDPEPALPTRDAFPRSLIDAYGTVFFAADDGATGHEPYVTDGTSAGTRSLGDLTPGADDSDAGFFGRAAVGTTIFFDVSNGPATGLWKTDGTPGGTTLVLPSVTAGNFVPWGTELFLGAYSGVGLTQLWRTDGSSSAAVLNGSTTPSAGYPLALLGDRLLINANDGVTGKELWISDGTTAGTTLLADIAPGATWSDPREATVHPGLGLVFFVADNGVTGREVWVTDGTANGTQLLRDIMPGNLSSLYNPRFHVVGDYLMFNANDTTGTALWRTDGTPAGTVLVKRTNLSFFHGAPLGRDRLVFAVSDANSPNGVWVTDGFTSTYLAGMGSSFGNLTNFATVGSRKVYFTANPVQSWNNQIWETDGTTAGTRAVSVTFNTDTPEEITLSNGRVLFEARDLTYGRELFAIDPGATAQPVGVGCSSRWPAPLLYSDDPVLGSVCTVSGSNVAPGDAVILLLGSARPPITLNTGLDACFFYLDPATMAFLHAEVAASDTWSVPIPLPITPVLRGIRVGLQAIVGPTSTPVGADLTASVVWTFGA